MSMMSARRSAAVLLVLTALAAACSSSAGDEPAVGGFDGPTTTAAPDAAPTATDTTAPPPPGGEPSYAGDTPAPEFPSGLDWLNTSAPLTLAELQGKVVLLDFWTYGCINCIHILPDLKRLEEEFADELVVIGVHSAKFVNESATDNIRQVIVRYDIEHPVVNDRDFEVWRAWGANAWPTTVVVDPAGNVVGGHAGEGVYEVVAPVISSLVTEFDGRGALDRTPLTFALEKTGQPNRALSFPGKVHVSPGDERLFIADTAHNRIVVADRTSGEVTAVYGSGIPGRRDGPASSAAFDAPQGLALDRDGVTLYVADTNNHSIRAIDTTTGTVTTLLGTGEQGWPPTGGVAPDIPISSPWDVVVDGATLYIAMAGTHQIWSMDLETGIALPLVGNGREGVLNSTLDQAELAQPSGLAIAGGILYFADSESSSIRSADLAAPAGETALVAGGATNLFEFGDADGSGDAARFQHPLDVVVWGDAAALIVADTYNSRLRLVDPVTREVTTYLGGEQGWQDGSDPRFAEPGGLAVDGTTLYVADTNNHAVRVVDLTTGTAETLVLKGIETFEPRPEDADYKGAVVSVPPLELAAGEGQIVLDVALPDGYKVNDEAPSSALITVDGEAVSIADANTALDLTGASFPVRVPIELSSRSADITVDLTVVYCRDEAESLCFIDQVRFIAAVTVGDGADTDIMMSHDIPLPDING
jgi:DNA-binding beta-propeller fold protein YncE